jgi:hypothetical protein
MKHGKRILGLVGVAVGLIFVVLLSGCGNSTAQQEQQYKQQWTQVMNKFETRVTSDDTKANDLATKNDIVGLRSLINSRLANVNDVLAQVLKLDPPEKYQRVQITTLYYLMALEDQLKAQNDVNDAALAGNPTTDLKTISDGYTKRAQGSGQELALELKKANLTVGTPSPSKPSSSTPKSTTPSK